MVTEAVKMTLVASQIVLPWSATIEAVGAAPLFTVIVILLLFATAGTGHVKLLVILHVTISPLFSVDVLYVELFVPTAEPLSIH